MSVGLGRRVKATHRAAIVEPTPDAAMRKPNPDGADVQDVVGQRRDEDLEVHPERGDEADDRHGEQHERGLADVARALGEVLDDGRPRRRAERSRGDRPELAVAHREVADDHARRS